LIAGLIRSVYPISGTKPEHFMGSSAFFSIIRNIANKSQKRTFLIQLFRRHVTIQSARDFTFATINLPVDYKSDILGISATEYCSVYQLRDVIVHSKTGLAFFKPAQFGETLIEESSKDITHFIVFDDSKTDTANLFDFSRKRVKRLITERPVILFFPRRSTTPGGFHSFVVFDLCPLLLLLEALNKLGKRPVIVFSREILAYQKEYLSMLSELYGLELNQAPEESHFRVKGPTLFYDQPIKKYFRSVLSPSNIQDWWGRELESGRALGLDKDVDFLDGITSVHRELPDGWENMSQEWLWGRHTKMKRLPANTATECLWTFAQAVNAVGIRKAPRNDVVYISRNDAKSRLLENEGELTSKCPEVTVVKWSDCTQKEKMEIAYNAKVIIGVHGAGLTAGYFMRPGMTVIEIHPRYFRYPDLRITYKVMCESRGLRYIGMVSTPLVEGSTTVEISAVQAALQLAADQEQ
jgi:hypothetical protein